MPQGMFERINRLDKLEFLFGDSAEELRDKLKAIRMPTQVVNIYGMSGKHYCWILTEAKIVKETKKVKGV